jgi:hypothetical protein
VAKGFQERERMLIIIAASVLGGGVVHGSITPASAAAISGNAGRKIDQDRPENERERLMVNPHDMEDLDALFDQISVETLARLEEQSAASGKQIEPSDMPTSP